MTIKLGDIGSTIIGTIEDDGVAVDISSGSSLTCYLIKPDGSRLTETASLNTDGKDGKIKYSITDGVDNKTGYWEAKFHARTASGQWTTDPIYFKVEMA